VDDNYEGARVEGRSFIRYACLYYWENQTSNILKCQQEKDRDIAKLIGD
jgi:hypothetical protein